jgi:ferrous iron transport protein A
LDQHPTSTPTLEVPETTADPDVATAPCGLATAPLGRLLRVCRVVGDDALAQRLRASGLWDGSLVEMVCRAPFGGPLLFKLHGFRLALRRNEAERVLVCPVEDRG